jgi:competence protein ComEC
MKTYPLIIFAVLFASGIAAGSLLQPPLIILYIFLFLLITTGIAYYFSQKPLFKIGLTFFICITIFLSGMFYYIPKPVMPLKGTIHKEEVTFFGTVKDINISQIDELRFTAHSDSIIFNNRAINYNGNFYCVINSNHNQQLYPGYKIIMNGTYVKGKNVSNPGEFDYEAYLRISGVSGYIYTSSDSNLFIRSDNEDLISGSIYKVRLYISRMLDELHTKRVSALLKGLLLADRKDIEYDIRTNFINSGTAHVLALSGLHVGFILLIFYVLTGRLNLYLRSILTIAGLVIFIFITGAPASVLRASLMAIVVIAAFLTNRSTNVFNSLAISAMIILLIDPSQLFLPGFQLSYTAVISIAIFFPLFREKIDKSGIQNDIIKKILLFISVTLAAQIGTLPLVLHYFSKLSFVSIGANVIVIPLIGMITGTAFVTLLISPLLLEAGKLFASANELMTDLLYSTVDITGNFNFSFIRITDFSAVDSVISYIILALMLTFIRKTNHQYAKASVVVLCVSIIVLYSSFDDKTYLKDNYLNCYMIDVGQGDAILLKFPSGKTALIDAGETNLYFDTGERITEPLLNYFGINKIDYAFISHLDSDHYSGFIHLIKNGYIDFLYKPHPDTSDKDIKFERFLRQCNVDFSHYSGDELKLDKAGIYFLNSYIPPNKRFNSNDQSQVLLLVYGKTSFLFTGDAGFKAEQLYIDNYGDLLKADVLKVSHHGSATATSDNFLKFINPKISLISAGEKNKFGHPSEKTISRLEKTGTKVYRTDLEGGILLRSDGYKVTKINWKEL